MVFPPLHLKGERLRHLARLPCGGVLERFDRPRLIEVEHGIELVRQPCQEVVAQALGFGTVDDPDGPLELGVAQALCHWVTFTPGE
jgi:hypothetical protein